MNTFRLPTWLAVLLAVIAAVLEYLNISTFGFPVIWHYFFAFGIAALAYIGIAPATHAAFQTALHLSHAASLLIATVLSIVNAAILTLHIAPDTKALLIGLSTLVGGLLFGPSWPGAPAPPQAPRQAA